MFLLASTKTPPQLFAAARVLLLIDRQRVARDTWRASVALRILRGVCSNMHEPPNGGSVTTRASAPANPTRIGILRKAFCSLPSEGSPGAFPYRSPH
jgi:hypothetical protein